MVEWLRPLERSHPAVVLSISVIGVAVVGAVDALIAVEISTSLFYVAPIAFSAWYGGRGQAVAVSVLAALLWLMTDRLWVQPYEIPSILFWNSFVRLALFLIIAVLLAGTRVRLRKEETLARTDALTGLLNTRAFTERAAEENRRLRRFGHAFSLAYIDLDNFKTVNDRHGHAEGDAVLTTVAEALRGNVRETDAVERIGGDEFAVLFVETRPEESEVIAHHLLATLSAAMEHRGWPITFSIGMVTFARAPDTTHALVSLADQLMYTVKRAGKNSVVHRVWEGDGLVLAAPDPVPAPREQR